VSDTTKLNNDHLLITKKPF